LSSPAVGETRGSGLRRRARIRAFQVLYEVDGARHTATEAFESRSIEDPLPRPADEFARKLIEGSIDHLGEIDATISTHAPTWPLSQMSMVDRNILRIAIFEILIGRETPPKVAINEAVEVSKIFGADSAPRFVNGVLGSIMETEGQTSSV